MDRYNFKDNYFRDNIFQCHGGLYTFGRERVNMVDRYDYRDDYFKRRSEDLEIGKLINDAYSGSILRKWRNEKIIEAGIRPIEISFIEFSNKVVQLGSQTTFCDNDGVFTITFNKDFSNDRELNWIDRFKRWLNSPSPI